VEATVFDTFIYRDEPDNASVETIGLGWFPSRDEAEQAAREAVAARRWTLWSATVDGGTVDHYITEDGIDLPTFEDDYTIPRLSIGPDWRDLEPR